VFALASIGLLVIPVAVLLGCAALLTPAGPLTPGSAN
jgi:hypothetical protein